MTFKVKEYFFLKESNHWDGSQGKGRVRQGRRESLRDVSMLIAARIHAQPNIPCLRTHFPEAS